MATASMQHHTISAGTPVRDSVGTTPERGFFTRVTDQVRQLICGMHGHDSLLHFEHGRMSLLCSSCGYESPGWELKGTPRPHAADARPRIVRLPLVGERRVA